MSVEDLKENDKFKSYCASCHSQERVLVALKSMVEADEANFEKYLHEIIIKKLRASKGKLSHQDAKEIEDFLISIIKTTNQ